jgi:hypothetical protein
MSIKISEIKVGYIYKTPNNQERVTLEVDSANVTYTTRGGNVKNDWLKHRVTSTIERFADACDEEIGQVSDEKLADLKTSCNC